MQAPGTGEAPGAIHRHMRGTTTDQGWEAGQLLTSALPQAADGLPADTAQPREALPPGVSPSTSCSCQGLFKPHLDHSCCY